MTGVSRGSSSFLSMALPCFPPSGIRMTQEAFQESSMKELGRLEAQLASLRQELAALTLRQNSVADEVGLLPQKIQAARADVS